MNLVCSCFNIKVEIHSPSSLEKPQFQLTTEEKSHPFFCQDVSKLSPDKGHIRSMVSALVKSEVVGSWNICQCSICKLYTHAANYTNGVLACSNLLREEILDSKGKLKNRPKNYSFAFQLVLPTNAKPTQLSSALLEEKAPQSEAVREIKTKAKTYVDFTEKKVEASIKAFAAKQRQTLENLKRQVQHEENVLLHLFTVTKEEEKKDSLRDTTNINRLRSSPQHPDNKPLFGRESKENKNRSLTSPNFDAEAVPLGVDPSLLGFPNYNALLLEDELSHMQMEFDPQNMRQSEQEIFDMDEFLPLPVEPSPSEPLDDSDEDLSYVERAPAASLSREIARSVPINISARPIPVSNEQTTDKKKPMDDEDIAASIQELAKSVRESSEDVFGELPRPKLPKDAQPFFH